MKGYKISNNFKKMQKSIYKNKKYIINHRQFDIYFRRDLFYLN